jgi:hypothetical protein
MEGHDAFVQQLRAKGVEVTESSRGSLWVPLADRQTVRFWSVRFSNDLSWMAERRWMVGHFQFSCGPGRPVQASGELYGHLSFREPVWRELLDHLVCAAPGPRRNACRRACIALLASLPLPRDARGCVARQLWKMRIEEKWIL